MADNSSQGSQSESGKGLFGWLKRPPQCSMARMIVVGVRGRRSALVGWRALVAGALAIAVAWMPMAPVAFVIIGAAMTLGLVLLLLVPRLLRLPAGRDRAFGNPR